MIYAKLKNGIKVIGLSFENLDRLKQGNPILMKPEMHKVDEVTIIFASSSQGELPIDLEKIVESVQ